MLEVNCYCEDDAGDGKHLWSSLLAEVRENRSVNLPARKTLLILGDNEAGKTTLIARLQGSEDPKKSSGLEYHFIDIKDEDRDDQTKLSVWVLDGDPYHSNLLKFALNEDNFADCLVLIMVSMQEPWQVMDDLNLWTDVLKRHVDRLKIPPDQMAEYRESLVRHFKDYIEPDAVGHLSGMTISSSGPTGLSHSISVPPGRRTNNPLHPSAPTPTLATTPSGNDMSPADRDKDGMPLTQGALVNNLGIPVVIVITKTDVMGTLEKEHELRDEHFDFIQMYLRQFCLSYGAALFYTSVKEDKNCDLLKRYIEHRVYGFPFTQTAYVVEKEAVFIPTGWDNQKKIRILEENLSRIRPEEQFNEAIAKRGVRKPAQREPEITANDEQTFLMRLASLLNREAGPGSGMTNSPTPSGPQSSAQQQSLTPGGVGGSGVVDPMAAAVAAAAADLGLGPGGGNRSDTGSSPLRSGGAGAGSGRQSGSCGVGRNKPGAVLPPGSIGASEGVLANFFNSLLTKRTPTVGGQGGVGTADLPPALTAKVREELSAAARGSPAATNGGGSSSTSAAGDNGSGTEGAA